MLATLSVHLLELGDILHCQNTQTRGCCYVSTSSMSELRPLGPLQDVLVLARILLVGLCLGGGETEIVGEV